MFLTALIHYSCNFACLFQVAHAMLTLSGSSNLAVSSRVAIGSDETKRITLKNNNILTLYPQYFGFGHRNVL